MVRSQHYPAELLPGPRLVDRMKQFAPVIATFIAIAVATGAAFVALVWLDSSIRFLTPAVIRLGEQLPSMAGAAKGDPAEPAERPPAIRVERNRPDPTLGAGRQP